MHWGIRRYRDKNGKLRTDKITFKKKAADTIDNYYNFADAHNATYKNGLVKSMDLREPSDLLTFQKYANDFADLLDKVGDTKLQELTKKGK